MLVCIRNSLTIKKQFNELISEVDNIYLSIDMDVLSSSEFNSVSYLLIGGVRVDTLLYIIFNYNVCFCKVAIR
jgi:arginase family enzyme